MMQPLEGKFETFFRLEKFDPFQGIAIGVAAAQEPDRDKEVLNYAASKPYFQNWSASVLKDSQGKSFGNVRFQHDDKRPVGRLFSLDFDDAKKQIRVGAQVVEQAAKDLLAAGVLTGFSIGGRYVSKTPITGGLTEYVADPSEISVVDRPCAPSAVYSVVKQDGTLELRKFAKSGTNSEAGVPMDNVTKEQIMSALKEILDKAVVPTTLAGAEAVGEARVAAGRAQSDTQTATHADPEAGDKESGKTNLAGADAEGEKRTGGETSGTERAAENPVVTKPSGAPIGGSMETKPGEALAGAAKVAGGGPESTGVGGDPGVTETEKKKVEGATETAVDVPSSKTEAEKAVDAAMLKVQEELAAAQATVKKIQESTASYEALAASVESLKKMLGDKNMAPENEALAKARKSVAGHVADIEKALHAHKSAHESLHKAHELLLDAHKAAHEAHKSAHEARLAHKASHDVMHGKVAESLDGIKKVLGGGPESEFAAGGEHEAFNPAGIGGTNAPVNSPDSALAGKTITPEDLKKAVAEAVALAVAEMTKAAKKCSCGKAIDGDGEKCAACKEAAAKAVTVDPKEAAKALMLEVFKALETQAPAQESVAKVAPSIGIGNRSAAVPLVAVTKIVDNGTGNDLTKTADNQMSPADWKAYGRGDAIAFKKAQRLTENKWQPVPARILNRGAGMVH